MGSLLPKPASADTDERSSSSEIEVDLIVIGFGITGMFIQLICQKNGDR
jgi:glycerol-3-phosphate dehydrogenase